MASPVLEHLAVLVLTLLLPLFEILLLLVFLSTIILPLFYIIWYLYDRKTPFLGGPPLKFMRNLPIWRHLANYFNIKLHKTADLDPSKNYIFAFHPHVRDFIFS